MPPTQGQEIRTSSGAVVAESPVRLLYPTVSVLVVAIALIGFNDFYFHGRQFPARPIPPPLLPWVISHGTAMALWMLILVGQTVLVARGQKRLHMKFGKFGAVVGFVAAISGAALAIVSTIHKPEMPLYGMSRLEFLSVPLLSVVVFGLGIGAAIHYRFDKEKHGSLIVLSTILAANAAIGRIPVLHGPPFDGAIMHTFGPYFWTVVMAWALYAVKGFFARQWGGFLLKGCVFITLYSVGSVAFSRTEAWKAFALLLVGPGPGP